MRNPRTARIAEIAAHWALRDHDTVRKILKAAGIRPASLGPARYRWADIWAFEGAGWVGPADEAAFRAPLRTPHEVGAFFPGRAVRTIIDQARKKRIPAIRIGKHWRFREITLERWLDHMAGERVQPGSAASRGLSGKAAGSGATSADRPPTYQACMAEGGRLKPPPEGRFAAEPADFRQSRTRFRGTGGFGTGSEANPAPKPPRR